MDGKGVQWEYEGDVGVGVGRETRFGCMLVKRRGTGTREYYYIRVKMTVRRRAWLQQVQVGYSMISVEKSFRMRTVFSREPATLIKCCVRPAVGQSVEILQSIVHLGRE